jgi:TonB-linked SusC/RagA family outer membrane protein
MQRFLFFIAFCLGASALNGQQINGKVTDTRGDPIPGVTVQLLGTTIGTTTDVDGVYRISAEKGLLRFSYIGYITQEVTLAGQTVLNIVLEEDIAMLSEIVVIGYGTQKKKDLTTAVSVVDEKELKDRRIISAAEALQGKAAGVQVTSPSGKPGVDLSVRVRGSTSVLAGNEPLYVVDGVPTTDIRGLNPSDIASMTVLKDASSAAIYGARAANGVVLITTRRGIENEPSLRFNTYFGVSRLRKTIDVLNTKQYRDLMNDINPGNYDPTWTEYHNWSDSVFGTGYSQSYQFSYGGGSDKSRYFLSAGYLSDEGIVRPARFDRYSVRVNLDNELKPWLKIGTSINILQLRTKDTPDNLSSGRGGVIMSTLNTPPFLDVYKDDGSGQYQPNPFQPSWENPIAYMYGPEQEASDNRLFGNLNAEFKIIEGLVFKTNFGLDMNSHQWDYYLDPFRTSYGRDQNGIGRSDKRNSNTWLWENTVNCVKSFENHHFSALVGSSTQKYKTNDTYIYGNDFPADVSVKTINAANSVNGSTTREEWALASFFGRVTYDFNYKYYLTVSVREDGSSKLANHWGTMPSFSAGWRISSEPFMKSLTFLNDLKIRGGYGINGNQEGISPYARYGLITYYHRDPTNPLSGPASYQYTYGNPDLKWETTAQTNVGIDISMINSRVNLTIDAYYKKTSDVILNVQLPTYLPITFIQTNAADIENKGIEFSINTVNIDKKVRWITDFNMSFNRNEVTSVKFPGIYTFGWIYSNNSNVSILQVGKPLGTFYGYVAEGVNPETGDMIYKDVNNNGISFQDGIFDTGDRTVIGNAQPDFTFGFTNVFSYWRFDLNIFFQGSYGNDIYNATRIDLEGMFDSKNQSVAVLDRWTPDNTDTDIPRAIGGGNVDNVNNSSRFIEDGSYIRLKSITLSYDIFDEKNKIKAIRRLSVFFTGQNLLTFTKYSGFDPEVNAYGNSATEIGIDYGTYPQSITMLVGLNVEF